MYQLLFYYFSFNAFISASLNSWAGIVRRYLDVQELDREIVEELIDHIEIGERSIIDGQRHQDIKIFYRFVGVV